MPSRDDPEWRAAVDARFRGRLAWLTLGAVLVLRWGPIAGEPLARGGVLALATSLFAYLNLPTWNAIARARREGVPLRFWRPLVVSLVIKALAYLIVVALVW